LWVTGEQSRAWIAVVVAVVDPAMIAVEADVFPQAYHRWCMYHLIVNISRTAAVQWAAASDSL